VMRLQFGGKNLLGSTDKNDQTVLHYAAYTGNVAVSLYLSVCHHPRRRRRTTIPTPSLPLPIHPYPTPSPPCRPSPSPSVATHLRRGGIFKYLFVANLPASLPAKNFENGLIFGEVVGKSLVSLFDSLT